MARKRSKADQLRLKKSLVTYMHPDHPISDQFRSIRSNIQFISAGRKIRSIMVTSATEGEGKTTTAVNLGVSMAHRGDKVLLIDTDFRRPTIHEVFNIKNVPGLTNILAGQLLLREAVHKTEIGSLDILASGPALYNSAEALGSPIMRELLEIAYKNYDMVILDIPAVTKSADAKMLAGLCDGSLLVVRSGKTKERSALEAKRVLELAQSEVLGLIVNEG